MNFGWYFVFLLLLLSWSYTLRNIIAVVGGIWNFCCCKFKIAVPWNLMKNVLLDVYRFLRKSFCLRHKCICRKSRTIFFNRLCLPFFSARRLISHNHLISFEALLIVQLKAHNLHFKDNWLQSHLKIQLVSQMKPMRWSVKALLRNNGCTILCAYKTHKYTLCEGSFLMLNLVVNKVVKWTLRN
jgi:hypothetical protein